MEPGPTQHEAPGSSRLFRTPSGPPGSSARPILTDAVRTCPDADAQWVYVWECNATSPSRHSYDKLVVVGATGPSQRELAERLNDYENPGLQGRPPVHPAFLDAVRDGWAVSRPTHTMNPALTPPAAVLLKSDSSRPVSEGPFFNVTLVCSETGRTVWLCPDHHRSYGV